MLRFWFDRNMTSRDEHLAAQADIPTDHMQALRDEAEAVLEWKVDQLRQEPSDVLRRFASSKLVCEYIASSGTKFAVEYWGDAPSKHEVAFTLEASALIDMEWTSRLSGRYLNVLADGTWDTGSQRGY